VPRLEDVPVKDSNLNLNGLTFLVADPSAYFCTVIHGILRSFGASKVIETRDARGVVQNLTEHRIDILLLDADLPPMGGLKLARTIRRNEAGEYRTVPILILTSDTRATTVKNARDCGANMVVAKPLSPSSLYDRLAWIAFNPRNFIDCETYYGPDRRFKIEGYPGGVGRRKGDLPVEISEDTGPALSQDEIDNLLKFTRG
jgi:CheY-like chemotaxis protein